jgi:hypothetical protein
MEVRLLGPVEVHADTLLGAALTLWRGQALEDVPVAALAEERVRLEQRHLAVAEDRVQAGDDVPVSALS